MAALQAAGAAANGFTGPDPELPGGRGLPRAGALRLRRRGERAPSTRSDVRGDPARTAALRPRAGRSRRSRRPACPAHTALLSFGIRAQSLEDQQALIERVRGEIGEPGVARRPARRGRRRARRPAGDRRRRGERPLRQPLLADARRAARRRPRPARRLPLARAARSCRSSRSCWRAAGRRWSSGSSGIPLNPMSAALAALTIAIATEFSVILAARFHEERSGGRAAVEALRAAYARTGAAVLASAITATAGFAVLIASDVTDAARLRHRHRDRPLRRPARGDGRAAGGARALGRADEGPLLDRSSACCSPRSS